MTPSRYRGSLVVWTLLIAYASLYPFYPLRPPAADSFMGLVWRPRYLIGSDIAINVIAYVPLGTFACLFFRPRHGTRGAIARAMLSGLLLSGAMEACQLFIPNRVSSLLDVGANTLGAVLGALAFAPPIHDWVTRPLADLRERLVIPGAWGDAGLVLVMLWLLAQVNPGLPFFGAGHIGEDVSPEVAALQWGAVAMGLAGFGLFVSTLLAADRGALRATLLLLSVALWLKFTLVALMLVPQAGSEWMVGGRVLGLVAGLAAFLPLRRARRAVRTYLALVLVLAAALFSKIFGAYTPLDEFLRLFRWPHGQLANFASLTQYLHELWPLAAVVFLGGLFVRERRGVHATIRP